MNSLKEAKNEENSIIEYFFEDFAERAWGGIINLRPTVLNKVRRLRFLGSPIAARKGRLSSTIGAFAHSILWDAGSGRPFFIAIKRPTKTMLQGWGKYIFLAAGAITIADLFLEISPLIIAFSWGVVVGGIILSEVKK